MNKVIKVFFVIEEFAGRYQGLMLFGTALCFFLVIWIAKNVLHISISQ
jgi:hypothetical protein